MLAVTLSLTCPCEPLWQISKTESDSFPSKVFSRMFFCKTYPNEKEWSYKDNTTYTIFSLEPMYLHRNFLVFFFSHGFSLNFFTYNGEALVSLQNHYLSRNEFQHSICLLQ